VVLGLAVLLLLFADSALAASPCADCIQVAEKDLRSCLDNAISVDDKNECEEKREAQMKSCEGGECTAERLEREKEKKKNVPKDDQ